MFDIACHVCTLFAVSTWLTATATEQDTTGVVDITTRIATTGSTMTIGAMRGTIRIHTTTTGSTEDGDTGHTAIEECKLLRCIY